MDVSPWHIIPLLTLAVLLTSTLWGHFWQLITCYALLFLAYSQVDLERAYSHELVAQVESLYQKVQSMEASHKATLINLKQEQNQVLQRVGNLEAALTRG